VAVVIFSEMRLALLFSAAGLLALAAPLGAQAVTLDEACGKFAGKLSAAQADAGGGGSGAAAGGVGRLATLGECLTAGQNQGAAGIVLRCPPGCTMCGGGR
jgi:hypothetical protein